MVGALDNLRDAAKNGSAEAPETKAEVGSSHFWQCFFLATITNASRRQGALAYLVRRLPKFRISPQPRGSAASDPKAGTSTDALPHEAEAAISPEPGLLIRCFEAGLCDPQLLIQRGFLDLLVTHLPLDSPVLQDRIGKDDRERIVAAAAGVVSRRDMSLNRRLWAWFLGPEPTGGPDGSESVTSPTEDTHAATSDPSAYHAAYFSRFGLDALTQSVLHMINRPTTLPAERARPFRVCLSLMDRWEVGGLIVPEVFLPALQSIQTYSERANKAQVDEVLRSANTFFDGVDSGLIWGKLVHLVTSSLEPNDSSPQEALRTIRLAKFVLSHFNLKEEDMLLHHMPLMIFSALTSLNKLLERSSELSRQDQELVDAALEIIDSLVHIVPDRGIKGRDAGANEDDSAGVSKDAALQEIQKFYEESQGMLDVVDSPFTAASLGQFILEESTQMFLNIIQRHPEISAELPSKILANTIIKVQYFETLNDTEPFTVFQQVLSSESRQGNQQLRFSHLSAVTTVLAGLQIARPSDPYISEFQLVELVHPLIAAFWQHLSPLMPKYHVEAVRCMLQLHNMLPSTRMVEAALASMLTKDNLTSGLGAADACRRFAVIWTHTMYELSLQSEKRGTLTRRASAMSLSSLASQEVSFHSVLKRPLLLLLDLLNDEGTDAAAVVDTWLQDLPTLNKVFEIVVACLQPLNCLSSSDSLVPGAIKSLEHPQNKKDDSKECLYFLRHVNNMMKRPSQHTWATLAQEAVSQIHEGAPRVLLQAKIERSNALGRALSRIGRHHHPNIRWSLCVISAEFGD